MNLRVIYKARPQAVSRVVGLLRKEGFNPTVLDHPDATYTYASKWTNLVRIAVPPTEVEGARSVLAAWENSIRPSVDSLANSLFVQLVYSLLITLVIGAILFALDYPARKFLPWLFLVWILILIVVANLPRIFKK